MFKVDKKWWRNETKWFKFSPKKIRWITSNENLLKNATKWRIVSVDLPFGKCYIIEGYINNEWKFLLNTDVHYSTDDCHMSRNYENAYNRCKKLARKFPEIKMNNLIKESGMASMIYGSTGYKKVGLRDIAIY